MRIFWLLFRQFDLNLQRVLGVCVSSKHLVITRCLEAWKNCRQSSVLITFIAGSLCGGHQRSWLYHPCAGLPRELAVSGFYGQAEMCSPACDYCHFLCPSSYQYIVYGSILFFMFLCVDTNWKDLKSRWCQNLKWMQGSLTSKDFMEILGGDLHSHSFLRNLECDGFQKESLFQRCHFQIPPQTSGGSVCFNMVWPHIDRDTWVSHNDSIWCMV